jgi:alpha-methylacyl-CoA racemase
VVDAAMVDGAALQMALIHGFMAAGLWRDERGFNLLDSGAHFYETYETADGKWVAIGAIEPKFYGLLLEKAGIDDPELAIQFDPGRWPDLKTRLAEVFRRRTRDEWCEILEGSDACFAPVLSLVEAPAHPHNRHRGTFVELDGVTQPAPAPRFSRTPGKIAGPPPNTGEHTESALSDWGLSEDHLARLKTAEAIQNS